MFVHSTKCKYFYTEDVSHIHLIDISFWLLAKDDTVYRNEMTK